VKLTTFDTERDLIIVRGRVWDPHGTPRTLQMVLDTGAAETIIAPELLDELGYSAREHGEQIAVMRSAVGREEGYMLRVARFACLGFQETNFRVHAQDLPQGWGIDGLIGLSFLRQLNYEVRSLEGRIRVERAAG
jgi:predicted aspartyl protease